MALDMYGCHKKSEMMYYLLYYLNKDLLIAILKNGIVVCSQ